MAEPRTVEQKRAERALARVQAVKNDTGIKKSEYVTLAKRAPANIQTNGLGQTLAFWRSKGKGKRQDAAETIYQDVSKWVCKQMAWGENEDLLTKITMCNTPDYRRATVETMAFLNWLKRFAEAELGDEK